MIRKKVVKKVKNVGYKQLIYANVYKFTMII